MSAGGVFDRLFAEHAAPVLRAAGFKRRTRVRHWRRVRRDHVDLLDVHRFQGEYWGLPEVGKFELSIGTYRPELARVDGEEPTDLATVTYPNLLLGSLPEQCYPAYWGIWAVYEGLDTAAVGASIAVGAAEAIERLDAVHASSDALVEVVTRYARGRLPAVLASLDRVEAARAALRAIVRPLGPFDADADLDPSYTHLGSFLGLDPRSLRPPRNRAFIDWHDVHLRLRVALGTRLESCLPRDGRLHVQLLRPTRHTIATARRAADIDPALLDIEEVTYGWQECHSIGQSLVPYLRQREKKLPDLIATFGGALADRLMIHVHNLDDVTEHEIRARAPESILHLTPDPMGFAEAYAKKRRRLTEPPRPP